MNSWWDEDYDPEYTDGLAILRRENELYGRIDPVPSPPKEDPRAKIIDLRIQERMVVPGEYIEVTAVLLPEEYIVTYKYPSGYELESPADKVYETLREMKITDGTDQMNEFARRFRAVLLSYKKVALFPNERQFRIILEPESPEPRAGDHLPVW